MNPGACSTGVPACVPLHVEEYFGIRLVQLGHKEVPWHARLPGSTACSLQNDLLDVIYIYLYYITIISTIIIILKISIIVVNIIAILYYTILYHTYAIILIL